MIAVARCEPRAGIVGETGGTRSKLAHRRQHPRRLHPFGRRIAIHIPHSLGMPRSRGVRIGNCLERHVPAAVATIHHVDQSRVVAAVAVVVGGEQIAMVVERQFLRIAKPRVNHFQPAAIRPTAEHGPAARRGQHRSFGRRDMKTAVADRKVETAIGSPGEAVQVMSQERRVYAEAFQQDLAVVGLAVAVAVPEPPQTRDTGEPNRAVTRGQSGCQAIEHSVETVRVNRRAFGPAVAIAILEQPDLVGMSSEPIPTARELVQMFAIHRDAIGERANLKIVFQEEGAGPILLGALIESILFGDVDPIAFVQAERDRVAELRFRGKQLDLHSRWNSQPRHVTFGRRRPVRQWGGRARRPATQERRLRLNGERHPGARDLESGRHQ